jgi:hypothetical protein
MQDAASGAGSLARPMRTEPRVKPAATDAARIAPFFSVLFTPGPSQTGAPSGTPKADRPPAPRERAPRPGALS